MYSLPFRFMQSGDSRKRDLKRCSSTKNLSLSWFSARSKKVSPTVSLVNANASCNTTITTPSPEITTQSSRQNRIPFPSSPIPFPTPRTSSVPDYGSYEVVPKCFAPYSLDELEDAIVEEGSVGSGHGSSLSSIQSVRYDRPWHMELHRRRSQSCLIQTYFHDENNADPYPPAIIPSRKPRARSSSSLPAQEKQQHGKRPRTRSKTKKALADTQFLAVVYRSIAWGIHSRIAEGESDEEGSGGEEVRYEGVKDVMAIQDQLLLQRLQDNLLEQGCQSVELNSTPLVDPPLSPIISADPLSQPPEVLSSHQIVASLILRYRDRCAVRPRSKSPSGAGGKGSSPLRA